MHSDHLGSATVLADKDGKAIRRLAYKAFGEEVVNTGTGEKPPYTYTGKELDASGLLYYGARYYDPELGRWLSCDPALERLFHQRDDSQTIPPQMLNHYSYSFNNPIRFYDPDGEEPVTSQATDIDNLIKQIKILEKNKSFRESIQQFRPKNPKDAPIAYKKAFGGTPDKRLITNPSGKKEWYDNKNPSSRFRYVYTKDNGWIDMTHMLRMAAEIDFTLSNSHSVMRHFAIYAGANFMEIPAWKETVDIEESQKSNVNSYWSYEDAPSNLAGLNFLIFHYREYGFESNTPLSISLEKYLGRLHVTAPENAPNWSMMPKEENPYVAAPQNKSFVPQYTTPTFEGFVESIMDIRM